MENDPKPLLLLIETTPFCMTMMTKTIEGKGSCIAGLDGDQKNQRKEGKTPSANRRFEETIGTGSGSERHTNKPTTNIKMMTGLVTQNHDAHQFLTCSGAAEKQPAVSSIA